MLITHYQLGATKTSAGAEAANTAKLYTTAGGIFEYEKMSIAANVNDNFSISWGELKETYDEQDDGSVADVRNEVYFNSICLLNGIYVSKRLYD